MSDSLPDQGTARWICGTCKREFERCEDGIGHLNMNPNGGGYRICDGTLRSAPPSRRMDLREIIATAYAALTDEYTLGPDTSHDAVETARIVLAEALALPSDEGGRSDA